MFHLLELTNVILCLHDLKLFLLLCVLLVQFDQSQYVDKLVLLHADVHVLDVKLDTCPIVV